MGPQPDSFRLKRIRIIRVLSKLPPYFIIKHLDCLNYCLIKLLDYDFLVVFFGGLIGGFSTDSTVSGALLTAAICAANSG